MQLLSTNLVAKFYYNNSISLESLVGRQGGRVNPHKHRGTCLIRHSSVKKIAGLERLKCIVKRSLGVEGVCRIEIIPDYTGSTVFTV